MATAGTDIRIAHEWIHTGADGRRYCWYMATRPTGCGRSWLEIDATYWLQQFGNGAAIC